VRSWKRILLSMAMAICLLCAFCVTAGAAESYAPAVFKTTPFEAAQSDTVTTTLYLEENSNLIDFEFQLSYDTEFVELQSAAEAAELADAMEITCKDGAVHISYTRTSSNLTKKTDLATLTFIVNENVGPDSYDFLQLDENYQHEAHTMIDGDLFVLPMETEFAPLDIFNFGDVDLSHKVSIADVTYLRQHLAEIRTLSDYQLSLSDAYYDEEVSIADAVRIQQYLADKNMLLGNRVIVTFLNKDQQVYRVKSVAFGGSLSTIPPMPEYSGYYGGVWSTDPDEIVGTDFQNLEDALTVYAIYKKDASAAITFYKDRLSEVYYSQSILTGNLNLVNKLTYQDGYTADIYWSSSDNSVLNASTGVFTKPAYDTSVTLTATIISYQDGLIEAQDYIAFEYKAAGDFLCPTKEEIAAHLSTLFGETIDYNMTLPGKVTNEDIQSPNKFEVRLEWIQRNADGTEQSVVQLARSNDEQTVTLIAVATFNGIPLEDDGKIYFDNVVLSPVSIDEVRSHIISQIAANTGVTVSDGETLWNEETKYDATIKWISQNNAVATIDNNVVSIKDVVNGTALPIKVEVTYQCGEDTNSFELAYTVSVATDNALLVPGTNVDPELYDALKSATGVYGNLTTDALKDPKFVYLDLSSHPNIRDLSALAYCSNLRVLNISGLQVDETSFNQIASLSKLEALIANNCGIESLTVGGKPVLDQMINLKMLDLAHNKLTNLDSILSKENRYGQLEELFLNDNQLTDISALCSIEEVKTEIRDGTGSVISTYTENVIRNRAPLLRVLILDNNHLNDEDLAAFGNFKVLKYLSLGNNEITSVSSLKDLRALLELHLQGNQIEDVRDLRFLQELQSLYLSNNKIRNVFSGAKEVNVSYLRYLTALEILYLDHNDIEDISELWTLDELSVLNINNNHIQDLSMLSDKGETLVELYAENNNIDSFSFVQSLTGLTRLMLSNNGTVYESALNSYLSGLTELRTLTLSGKDLRSLSFLNNMKKLVRLDVANCNLPSYYMNTYSMEGTTLRVDSYTDNIAAILSLKSSLQYLDVSNNGLGYGAAGIEAYLFAIGEPVEVEQVVFYSGRPATFGTLYEMTNLKVLYADNLADPVDAPQLFSIMTGIRYLSMENCGIEDASWLSKFRNLVYVDLAGNDLTHFDLGVYISTRSRGTLEYLYIDSNKLCEFADAYAEFDGNVLKAFSASNVKVNAMDFLPDMTQLGYLNLTNSGITSLVGSNPDFDGWFNLSRYQTVKALDLSGVQADLDEVLKMENLETLYAVGDVKDAVFQKQNLHTLYELYNRGVDCYLYNHEAQYIPKADVEGSLILGTLADYSCDLTLAAEGLSDNNPELPATINGFDIQWSISNNRNYAVIDNRLKVVDYADIDDETLMLTASIDVYPGQAPATRTYEINIDVIRATMDYLHVNAVNAVDYLVRGQEFIYDVSCVSSPTDGFAQDVSAVCTEIRYTWSAESADGTVLPYTNFITESADHTYAVNVDAALGAHLILTVEAGHTIGGTFIADTTIVKTMEVVAETYNLQFMANGGVVRSLADGSVVETMLVPEETILFETIKVERPGYLFNGWFRDIECTELWWREGMDKPLMPSEDLALYASWTAYSFEVFFNAGEGSCSTGSKAVLVGVEYGELPVPSREGYTFNGWFTEPEGGELITADSIVHIESDQILYAQWTVNQYLVYFDANGGEVREEPSLVTYGAPYGALPVPARDGFIFNGWYTQPAGGTGVSADTLVSIAKEQTLYARWTARSYTVSWSTGTGYSISVVRTSSTYGGAATGTLSSGSTVFYGDTLSVAYTAANGYTLGGCGASDITVRGAVTSSTIYATATANNYTYNIVYQSSNGTSLGASTATYAYGTTNKITPNSYSGYTTPASQSVKWDTTGQKTITFVYTPSSVSATTKSGTVISSPKTTFSATVEFRNRTATSIQMRVKWTDTIKAYGYNNHAHKFDASFGGKSAGRTQIVAYYTWGSSTSSARSATAYSSWVTVPVSATTTSVSVAVKHMQTNIPGDVLSTDYSATWTVPIPTY